MSSDAAASEENSDSLSSFSSTDTAEQRLANTVTLTLAPLEEAADITLSAPLTLAIAVEVATDGATHVRPARSTPEEAAAVLSLSPTPDTLYAGVAGVFQAAVTPVPAPQLVAEVGTLAGTLDMQATNGTGTVLAPYLVWDDDDESWSAFFPKAPGSTLPSLLPQPRRSHRPRSWLVAIIASLLIIASSIGGLLWSIRFANSQVIPRTPTSYARVSPEHGPQQASINVTPPTIDLGTLAPGQQVASSISVSNTGSVPLTWTANTDAFWLTLGLTSGTIPAAGPPQTIPLTIDPSNLSAGNAYTTTVTITSNGGNQSISVSFELVSSNQTSVPQPTQPQPTQPQPTQPQPTQPSATISVSPQSSVLLHRSVPSITTTSFTITNSGGQNLYWSATTDSSWLTLNPSSDIVAPGNSQAITAIIDTQGVLDGSYIGTIHFKSNAGSLETKVIIGVVGGEPPISVTPSSIKANNVLV